MSSSPLYGGAIRKGAVTVSTANTARDGTGTISAAIVTAPTAGALLRKIRIKATGDPADSVVTVFLHDGTNFFLFDEFDIGNPAAASTTVGAYAEVRNYDDFLPNGWSVRCAITVALTSGVINVFVDAVDLT